MRPLVIVGALCTTALLHAMPQGAPPPQQIAFARLFPNAGQLGVFIAAADGSEERRLLSTTDLDYNPTWSPDGTSVVFTSDRAGSGDLFRVGPDGSGLERLTEHAAYDDQGRSPLTESTWCSSARGAAERPTCGRSI
jgi:Tol biopolymer transport system component